MSNTEKTLEKSQQQAEILKVIILHLELLDIEYLKEAGQDMIKQGNMQDTLAILNPSNPLIKNQILRIQGRALLQLGDFADLLKQVRELNKNLNLHDEAMGEINKLFV